MSMVAAMSSYQLTGCPEPPLMALLLSVRLKVASPAALAQAERGPAGLAVGGGVTSTFMVVGEAQSGVKVKVWVPAGRPLTLVVKEEGLLIVPGPVHIYPFTAGGVPTVALRLTSWPSQIGMGIAARSTEPSQQETETLEKVTDSSPAQVCVLTITVAVLAPFTQMGPDDIMPF